MNGQILQIGHMIIPMNIDIAPFELPQEYNSNIYGDSGVYLEGKEISNMLIGPA